MPTESWLYRIRQIRDRSLLEPSAGARAELEDLVSGYAAHFWSEISGIPAYRVPRQESRVLEEMEVRETPRDLQQILQVLASEVDHDGLNPASGGHLGYIPGGGLVTAAWADFLAAVTNRYAGLYFGGPGAVRLENAMIRWMADLVGYGTQVLGNLCSGGSIANLIGITTARDAKNIAPEKIRNSVIYLTAHVHHCVHKAIRIAGLGACVVREVPMNERYEMDTAALERLLDDDSRSGLHPFLVIASLGTTDAGAIDPLDEIRGISERHGCWMHVDAAYGGFFLLLPEYRSRFTRLQDIDSIVLDPHKGLFLPYGLGAVLVREGKYLLDSHYYRANYMQDAYLDSNTISPADLSPELTKHFRGLRLWFSLHYFGVAAFREYLEEKILLCRLFQVRIREAGFETGPEPALSVGLYRYPFAGDADSLNLQLTRYVQVRGRVFVSSTSIEGRVWIRIAVLSFRTHLEHIDWLVEDLCEGVKAIREGQSA